MKVTNLILTSIFTFLTTFSFAQIDNSEENYKLSHYYSYYDVYHIQSSYTNNDHCIQEVTLSEGGKDRVVDEYKDLPYYDSNGQLQYRQGVVSVKKPGNYTTYKVLRNTCSYDVVVKGIYKYRNEFGGVSYENCSLSIDAKGDMRLSPSWYFMDNFDDQRVSIGSHILHTNNLVIDKNVYDTYLKKIANNPSGTIPVYSATSVTRIFLKEGDKVSIRAEGSVKLGMFAGSTGPNGIEGFTSYSTSRNARHGSLIYRLGDDKNWHFAGSNATITADRSGTLRLAVNDDKIDDNDGKFIVNYKITRANSTNNTSNTTTNNVSNIEDNKFVIRNSYKDKIPFQLSNDEVTWATFSLEGLAKSDYWFPTQKYGFFRVKTSNGKSKVYKIVAAKKYLIKWNDNEGCWDLFADGDR